jgi:hypothetical protein
VSTIVDTVRAGDSRLGSLKNANWPSDPYDVPSHALRARRAPAELRVTRRPERARRRWCGGAVLRLKGPKGPPTAPYGAVCGPPVRGLPARNCVSATVARLYGATVTHSGAPFGGGAICAAATEESTGESYGTIRFSTRSCEALNRYHSLS